MVSPVSEMESFQSDGEFDVPDRWWTVFNDSRLNDLVDSALINNMDLQTAWYRLREAQAIEDRASSSFFPSIGGDARAESREPGSENRENNQFQLGLSAEYEVDLWGRVHSAVEAERARAQASWLDYEAAALSLSAEIVNTWYELIEARNQIDIAAQQVETNARVLELVKARFEKGQGRRVNILRQEQLLEATRAQKIAAESREEVLQHQLAVLLGRPPGQTVEVETGDMPGMPPLPGTGLPVELVRRRPDVQRAFELVRAADQDMASAISNQYPRLNLSASFSTSADEAGDLFDSWVRSFAGNLFAPLFYGGELRAEVDRADAVRNQRIYQYGQTVLTAFQEVEDALVREKKQLQSIESIEKQLELARESNEQIRVAYFNGIGNYLDVLTALDEEQQLQRDLLSEKLTLLEYRIALYRALAGGFEIPSDEEGEQP
ncbi:MAG: efflux transporter outer membrane subunit [Marinilabilia sp.]